MQIAIDRTKGTKTLKNLLVQCKTVFDNKRNLIIFPEGTRTIPLEEKKFKSGIALIKKHFQHIPLIPVALNSGLFWPKDSWVIKPGIMKLQILPEIKYTNNEEFLTKLQKEINHNSHKLCRNSK